jgi:hypothetical protein
MLRYSISDGFISREAPTSFSIAIFSLFRETE